MARMHNSPTMQRSTNIVLQAIANQKVGTGHFARTGAIAEALSFYDSVCVTLITNTDSVGLIDAFFKTPLRIIALADDRMKPPEILRALVDHGVDADLMFVDQYGSIEAWESQLSGSSISLATIDDLGEADTSDWIIRPIPSSDSAGSNKNNILEGPEYLPLSRAVTAVRATGLSKIAAAPLRVNICFGGSDPTRETDKAVRAVADINGIMTDLLLGPRAQVSADTLNFCEKAQDRQ